MIVADACVTNPAVTFWATYSDQSSWEFHMQHTAML